jgi:uncharacterized membrane protein YphA (DoxX/SURF4 family)
VVSPFVFWPCFLGLVFLLIGLVTIRRELVTAVPLEKSIALGYVFVAAPLAAFAGEHLAGARVLMQGVPPWMPARLFWVYFVGIALLAAALSLALKRCVRWSAPLLTLLFFLFVLSIHVPGVVAHPNDRIRWAVVLRDSAFACGGLALTGFTTQQANPRLSRILIFVARLAIGIVLIVFGVEHLLHPEFAPGVPLPKLTPSWVPLPLFWAYLVGAVLLVAGAAILLNKRSRMGAATVGLVMTLLTLVLYSPLWAMARGPSQTIEGLNYVADTLLFAGTILLLAMAMPTDNRVAAESHLQ